MEEAVPAIRNLLKGEALAETLFLLLNEATVPPSPKRTTTWVRMIVKEFEAWYDPHAKALDTLTKVVESYADTLHYFKPQDVAAIVAGVKLDLQERGYDLLQGQTVESFLAYARPEHYDRIKDIVNAFLGIVLHEEKTGLKEAFSLAIQRVIVDKEPFDGDIEKFSIALSESSELHPIINHAEVTLKIMGYDLEASEEE